MRVIWIIAWIFVALWSLFLAGAYGVVELAGSLLGSNADKFSSDPETVVLVADLARWMRSLGGAALALIWAFGTALMLAVPWAIGKARAAARYPAPQAPYLQPPMQHGPNPQGPVHSADRLPR